MKKQNLLLTLLLAIFIISCSNESSDISETNDLLGTWIGVDIDYTGNTVTDVAGQSLTVDFVGEAYDVDYTLNFTDDPNELVSNGSYSIELTTTVLGQVQVNNVENIEFLEDGTWSKTGDELTISSNGETVIGTILELTEDTLILSMSTVEDLSQAGASIITTVDLVSTFRKQ